MKKPTKALPTKWDLSPLFKSINDPMLPASQKEAEKISQAFIKKWKAKTDYLENPTSLRKALDEYEKWEAVCGPAAKATYYFSLLLDLDQGNPAIKARFNKAKEISQNLDNEMHFFTLRLAKVTPAKQHEFLKSDLLKPYRHWLTQLFAEAPHLLSEPEERIITLKSSVSHFNWVRLTSDLLAREERAVLAEDRKKGLKSFSAILGLISNSNKRVRDTAAEALNDILIKHIDVAEAELNSVLENKKVNDGLRHFIQPEDSRLLSDDIDKKTVDTMVETVSRHFTLPVQFYKLKAKLLKTKVLAYHERSVAYGKTDLTFTYEEAVGKVRKVFSDLDPDFEKIFSKLVQSGRIDVLPRTGKSKGAYCSGFPVEGVPTYILLNFTQTLHDVLTIAHETGHAINFDLSKEKQNKLNYGAPLSTAEVASTYMEDFVLSDIMQQADDETKLTLLIHKLDEDIATIFRQVAAYRFEQELHHTFAKVGYLSKKEIGTIFAKHMKSYMGPAVLLSPGSENWWVYWGHFRRPFYVYSYASGQLISKAMQRMTRQDPQFISKVKEFLSAGMSDSPKNIFARMDIDISRPDFWQTGLEEIAHDLKEAISLAKKLKRI